MLHTAVDLSEMSCFINLVKLAEVDNGAEFVELSKGLLFEGWKKKGSSLLGARVEVFFNLKA